MNIPEGFEPFSYEEALKRPEDLIYRCGDKAKFAAYVPEAAESQRIVSIMPSGSLVGHYESGQHFCGTESYDLFLRPKTNTVYRSEYGPFCEMSDDYNSLEKAMSDASPEALAILAFSYQSGKLIKVEIAHTY